jgi:nicotinamide-nucleotide amidase
MSYKKCEIICVGTELLLGDILNTNARFLARRLSQLGLDVYLQTVVGDNQTRLTNAVKAAMERADILLFTGGLGPTQDDITKEVVSSCFGRELRLDQEALDSIRQFYAATGRTMPQSNTKQALMPEGGMMLPNPQGTAPGCILFSDAGHVAILMPGPPRELQPMFDASAAPYLRQFSTGRLYSRVVKVISLGESHMAELLQDLIENGQNPTLAPYAKDGEAMVRITAKAKSPEEADALITPMLQEIKARLGRHVYGVDVPNLESAVSELLRQQDLRLSILEAGSAGQAAQRLQATELAPQVCSPCLSAPTLSGLGSLCSVSLPEETGLKEACLRLAQEGAKHLGVDAILAIALHQGQFACAAKIGERIRQHSQNLPNRSPDYHRTLAVQAALDMVRLML